MPIHSNLFERGPDDFLEEVKKLSSFLLPNKFSIVSIKFSLIVSWVMLSRIHTANHSADQRTRQAFLAKMNGRRRSIRKQPKTLPPPHRMKRTYKVRNFFSPFAFSTSNILYKTRIHPPPYTLGRRATALHPARVSYKGARLLRILGLSLDCPSISDSKKISSLGFWMVDSP